MRHFATLSLWRNGEMAKLAKSWRNVAKPWRNRGEIYFWWRNQSEMKFCRRNEGEILFWWRNDDEMVKKWRIKRKNVAKWWKNGEIKGKMWRNGGEYVGETMTKCRKKQLTVAIGTDLAANWILFAHSQNLPFLNNFFHFSKKKLFHWTNRYFDLIWFCFSEIRTKHIENATGGKFSMKA